jgi:Cd2+/Zn2+-exporting ATPase
MSQVRCTIKVRGLDCPSEIATLRSALERHPGIQALGFDVVNGTMTVDYTADVVEPAQIVQLIRELAGMHATVFDKPDATPAAWWARHGNWALIIGSGVALAAGLAVGWFGSSLGLGERVSERVSQTAFGCAVLIGGIGLVPGIARSLARFRFDIDVLMGLAIVGAMILGQWDEAATVAFLYGLSEALEALSLERARRSIRALLELTPPTAERIESGGSIQRIPADQIRARDRVLVRAGDTIPIDGTVASGRSSVDQKTITGESVPVLREEGDPVYAGTINGDGTLEVLASGPASDALMSRVVASVRESQAGRAPIERRISRFAAVYTPLVIALAVAVMLVPPLAALATGSLDQSNWSTWREWLSRGLVVLVIACPCALVIATPVAVVSGLAAAARRGVLIRGGEFLEEVGRLRAIAFDKTGTLTRGEPDVVEVVCAPGEQDQSRVLAIAAALGDRGGHVLGKAIARHARGLSLKVPIAENYQAIPGLGAQGQVDAVEYYLGSHRYIDDAGLCQPEFHDQFGKAETSIGTAVAVTAGSGPLGWIRLADRPRPEAARVLAELHRLGLRTIMLTGDNPKTAAAVARELGVGEERAALLPAEKVSAIAELDARHGPTGMVGDGVNDAPALAAAKVSIALGGISSGAALESADIVLLSEDLNRLPWLIRHSRATLARIRQNITLALATKMLVLILAMFGIANLWMAVAADVGTSLVVVANALRLLWSAPD